MKKRWVLLLALVLALGCVLPLQSAAAVIGPQYVNTSNGKGVNLRTGPSKDCDILTSIPYGAMVDSYEYYDGVWAQISYRGFYGFAMTRYFSSEQPSPSPSPTSKPSGDTGLYKNFTQVDYYANVNPPTPSGYVNLRWAPSKSAPIHGNYYAGASLHVISTNGAWSQVYDESTQTCGFMMSTFLTETYGGDAGIGYGATYGG